MEKNKNMFYGMYEESNNNNKNVRHFFEEVLGGPKTKTEIADYFRRTKLNGEKGWRIETTNCEYSREHESYQCPTNYYYISATFIRK